MMWPRATSTPPHLSAFLRRARTFTPRYSAKTVSGIGRPNSATRSSRVMAFAGGFSLPIISGSALGKMRQGLGRLPRALLTLPGPMVCRYCESCLKAPPGASTCQRPPSPGTALGTRQARFFFAEPASPLIEKILDPAANRPGDTGRLIFGEIRFRVDFGRLFRVFFG